ncbi:MAG: sigma 54-interacting transcriptional regulator [Syntrophomonadaceae bacterium]|jgi:transcriptional regulator of acetoin/glycerol metabolism|nr:sigma 54-interacting transcriptional regulator [Syntrophomonadaceae bacterium]
MHEHIMTSKEMLSMWHKLHVEKNFDDVTINKEIISSWARSEAYGVDPFKRSNFEILNKKSLDQRLIKSQKVLDVVMATLNTLHHITKGDKFGVVFADAEGYILKRLGNPSDIKYISYTNFIEGSKWSEDVMGSNAIGLALKLDKPFQVHGYEHFCKHNCLATCSAAPIHDQHGNIIGVLDLTASYQNSNVHTLGMAVASAKAIERELELKNMNHLKTKLYKELKLMNVAKSAIINAMSEGLISIDRNQIITTINTQACKMLGLSPFESSFWVGKHISEIGDITEEYLNKTIQFKSKFFAENMTIKINGQKKRFMINCTPYEDILYDDDNSINGALLILNKPNNIINKVVGARAKTSFEDMVGESGVFLKAVEQAKIASDNSSNILLIGESGVGKDLFAQSIHNASPRKNEPFLGINCAAIPRELISSELFGYEEGAFTGARKGGNPGKFELADQGTIFLDEIAEMPIDLQASLLRVLEERNIIRLGGKHFIPVNVRIITATNRNLLQQIEANSFRQDLYFRLNVISIHLPALRERKGDIPLLVEHFVYSLSNRLNKTVKHVKPEVYDCLINYDWPGNIRELNNIIERAINLCVSDTLTLDLIPLEIQEATMNTGILKWKKSILQEDEEKERQLIEYYLSKKSNNRSQVAKLLKISRSSLYRKMQKYNIY